MAPFADLGARAKARATRIVTAMAQTLSTPANEILVPAELKPILTIDSDERKRQKEVIRARDFHSGRQGAKLTKRLREWMGIDADEEAEWSMNFAATVVLAVVERLLLKGIKVSEDDTLASEDERNKTHTWAARLRRLTRLESKQADIHEGAIRDGEFFVVVDYDNVEKHARFFPHKRYTDKSVGVSGSVGDGEGVRMFYPNGDTNQKPLYAVKRWVERDGEGSPKKHLTIYKPDSVITYRLDALGWKEIDNVPWTDPQTGAPLGIPVVVWYTPGRKPEAHRIWSIQRIVNKVLLDLLQIIDVAAFRIWLFFGWSPKDADGKPLTISPNTWIGDATKSADKASATPVEGTDPAPVGEVLDGLIFKLAALSDTPPSRLMISRQVAAEGTLKQQSEPLIAKCRRRLANFSTSYEDLFNIARRLENAFGEGGLDESVLLDAEWEPLQARDVDEELKQAQADAALVAVQIAKQQVGVSQVQSQRELKYSDKQIQQMKTEKGEEKTKSADAFAQAFSQGN